jgi:hypothetical protein
MFDGKRVEVAHEEVVAIVGEGGRNDVSCTLEMSATRRTCPPVEMASSSPWFGSIAKKVSLTAIMLYQVSVGLMVFLQNEPVFGFLHSEARYEALVRKVGLPPTY